MSMHKSELQAAMAHTIGVSIEDRLEAVQNEIHQYDGAQQAISQAMKSLNSLFQHVDKDVEEGKYDQLGNPLQIAGVAKDYIKKAIGLLDNLETSSRLQGIRARGKVEGVQAAMDIVKKARDQAEAKVQAVMQAVREGKLEVENERPLGDVRPMNSAAEDLQARREKARKAREAKEAQENPQLPSEEVLEDSLKETVAPPRRSLGRLKGPKNKVPTSL